MFVGDGHWGPASILAIVVVFGAPIVYDQLYKTVLKDPKVGFVGGLILATAMLCYMEGAVVAVEKPQERAGEAADAEGGVDSPKPGDYA